MDATGALTLAPTMIATVPSAITFASVASRAPDRHGVLWRCAVCDVTGWSLGALTPG